MLRGFVPHAEYGGRHCGGPRPVVRKFLPRHACAGQAGGPYDARGRSPRRVRPVPRMHLAAAYHLHWT